MNILKIEWRTQFKSVFVWCGVVGLILLLFMSVFPSMKNAGLADIVNSKMNALPQNILKIFNLNDSGSLLNVMGYFAYVFQYIVLASGIYAVLLGSQSLIKEESDGTIEFLYAQPITRKELVWTKFIASLSILIVFWAITFSLSTILVLLFKNSNDRSSVVLAKLSTIFLNDGLILIALLAIGFFCSTLLQSSKQATGLSLGIVFGTYVLGVLSEINDRVSFFKYMSLLHYGVPANLVKGWMGWTYLIILVGVIVFFSVASSFIYQRKDLKIS
ncbi:ABC transporter permease subunit [Carnobacterium gallinarum]|uniref:ABC transporter permease subunit n=1 Tax=Carnobacterium gallinarum TaxID=2749 RepID=UPI0005513DC2|nr:ABC transporter permease subunit [Carnobacterium gallinarum]